MIYTVTAISFFLLSIVLWRVGSPHKTKVALILAMIWLTLHDGLRWEIGTDWANYYDFFQEGGNEHMGFTYGLFNQLTKSIIDSYTFFLLCFAGLSYLVIGKLLYKYSPNPFISICVYYCATMGIMGSNRQLLAMVFCIISVWFVIRRNKWLFIGTIIFATTIHVTAFSFILAYFLYNFKYTNRTALIVVFGAFIIGVLQLVNKIPFVEYLALIDSATSNTALEGYVSGDKAAGVSIVGSFKRIFYVYLALMARKYINSREYDYFLSLFIVGCCIYLIFNGSVLQIAAGRGAGYYSFYECIVMAYVIMKFPASFFVREVLWLLLFAIYFVLMWRDMNSYFLLDGIDIYNPYKSVLFENSI